jgi:SAM-dependent methyltransferase
MTSRSAQDREKWEELYASGARPDRPPSRWIVDTIARLPNDQPVADIAGGTGRHAVPLARQGRHVVVVDIVAGALAAARKTEPSLDAIVADTTALPLRPGQFGIVVVANYLDRRIFSDLIALLAPGGYLVYETYTLNHLDLVERGLARGPHSREYLLGPGELTALARPLAVVEYREADVEDEAGRRCCARLLAQSAERRQPDGGP